MYCSADPALYTECGMKAWKTYTFPFDSLLKKKPIEKALRRKEIVEESQTVTPFAVSEQSSNS